MNKTAVIGLGNIALRDEGAGIHALRYLKEQSALGGEIDADFIEGGVAGFGLFDLIKQYEKVIFLDAVNMGQPAGTVHKFSADQVVALQKSFSLHEAGLAEVIKLGQSLGEDFKHVAIFGIQPQEISYGEEISETVRHKIPDLISRVAAELVLPKEA